MSSVLAAALVGEKETCKVTDFGMARDVLTGQHLRTKIKGKRQNEESQRLVSSNPFV